MFVFKYMHFDYISWLLQFSDYYEVFPFSWMWLFHIDSNILTNDKNVIYIVAKKWVVNIFLSLVFIVAY
jgi:hypothetical protein